MVPFLVLLIPLYTVVVAFGWTNSLLGVIIPFMMNATAVLILRQSFLTVPSEIMDAARVDGASLAQTLEAHHGSQSAAAASKKADRTLGAGVAAAYTHADDA